MKKKPLVSVIIPAYNAEKYILECLDSVFNQEYEPLEVIVVDDGSTDATISLIKNKGIIVLEQDSKGGCAARNKGFTNSNGDFIQFLDADDILAPNKISSQIEQLISNPDAVSNGRWGRFYSDDPINEHITWGPHESLQETMEPVEWLCQNHMSQTACWLSPRVLIEEAGPWDEVLTINQDGEFFTRVVAKCRRVLYCPEAKVYYRSGNPVSVSSKAKDEKKLESLYRTCLSFEDILLNLENSDRTRKACADKYQEFVYKAYPMLPGIVREAEQRIKQFGGSAWPPYPGGKIQNLLVTLFGWKFPARLRHLLE